MILEYIERSKDSGAFVSQGAGGLSKIMLKQIRPFYRYRLRLSTHPYTIRHSDISEKKHSNNSFVYEVNLATV